MTFCCVCQTNKGGIKSLGIIMVPSLHFYLAVNPSTLTYYVKKLYRVYKFLWAYGAMSHYDFRSESKVLDDCMKVALVFTPMV